MGTVIRLGLVLRFRVAAGLAALEIFTACTGCTRQPPKSFHTDRFSEGQFRGSDLVAETWRSEADRPYLNLRKEIDALWKQHRSAGGKPLVPLFARALESWRKSRSNVDLYRAYYLGYVARELGTEVLPQDAALYQAWPTVQGLHSREMSRAVMLWNNGRIDDSLTLEIGFRSLEVEPADEPLELKLCIDTCGYKPEDRPRVRPIADRHLLTAYTDPKWAIACAFTIGGWAHRSKQPERDASIGWQCLKRYEQLTGRSHPITSSEQFEASWAKFRPKDRRLSSMPWIIGPEPGI